MSICSSVCLCSTVNHWESGLALYSLRPLFKSPHTPALSAGSQRTVRRPRSPSAACSHCQPQWWLASRCRENRCAVRRKSDAVLNLYGQHGRVFGNPALRLGKPPGLKDTSLVLYWPTDRSQNAMKKKFVAWGRASVPLLRRAVLRTGAALPRNKEADSRMHVFRLLRHTGWA